MGISAGRYRHRIKILKQADVRDEYGGFTVSRIQVANPWCRVTPLTDIEAVGSTTEGQLLTEFEIRFSKSLENPSSDMFLEFKNDEYDIISVINHLELNEKLKILAKRR